MVCQKVELSALVAKLVKASVYVSALIACVFNAATYVFCRITFSCISPIMQSIRLVTALFEMMKKEEANGKATSPLEN